MKAASRKTLAAALSLGAAVFASPVQALQCPKPLFWHTNMPVDEAYERMPRFAESKVLSAQSIFKGHAVSVKYIGPDEEYPVFILTFKVTEWIKGDRKPYARIAYEGWCDGGCPSILEEEGEILSTHDEKIYIAERPNTHIPKEISLPANIDGVFGLCGHIGRKVEPINQAQPTPHLPIDGFYSTSP